jgi:hypothetical protein
LTLTLPSISSLPTPTGVVTVTSFGQSLPHGSLPGSSVRTDSKIDVSGLVMSSSMLGVGATADEASSSTGNNDSSPTLDIGLVAGFVVGSLAFLICLIALFVVVVNKRRRGNNDGPKVPPPSSLPMTLQGHCLADFDRYANMPAVLVDREPVPYGVFTSAEAETRM